MKKAKRVRPGIRKIFNALFSSRLSPEVLARSVAVGTFIALTPTEGLQFILVGLTWYLFNFSGKLKFNLAIGMSATWITNYFTLVPYYFICYYTGIWFGNHLFGFKSSMSYDCFSLLWQKVLDSGYREFFGELINIMVRTGMPIFLGSIPYAVIGAVILYRVTYFSVLRYRRKVTQRMTDK